MAFRIDEMSRISRAPTYEPGQHVNRRDSSTGLTVCDLSLNDVAAQGIRHSYDMLFQVIR